MESNIKEIVNAVIKSSPINKSDIARAKGLTVQNFCNRLVGKSRKDMSCANAADLLSFCGYQLVVVPKGAKLPSNSHVVELLEGE